jgi:hypothetical protein
VSRVNFQERLDLDGNGGGSAVNLTKVLLFTKNLFYGVCVCWGHALIARPEEHTRARRSFLDLWPTYL